MAERIMTDKITCTSRKAKKDLLDKLKERGFSDVEVEETGIIKYKCVIKIYE